MYVKFDFEMFPSKFAESVQRKILKISSIGKATRLLPELTSKRVAWELIKFL
mgnify:FL=1